MAHEIAEILQGALVDNQPVEVHIDFGHVLGKMWRKGYVFHKYETHGEHPLSAFISNEPTCFVRIVGGIFDGCIVRYRVSEVRAQ